LIDDAGQVFENLLRPKPKYHIAHITKCTVCFQVILHIALDLGNPKSAVGFNLIPSMLPIESMPKLTVHKDGQFVFLDYDIRSARKGFVVKSETYSPCPKCPAQRHLRFRMFAFDPSHGPAALGRRVEASRFLKAGYIYFIMIFIPIHPQIYKIG